MLGPRTRRRRLGRGSLGRSRALATRLAGAITIAIRSFALGPITIRTLAFRPLAFRPLTLGTITVRTRGPLTTMVTSTTSTVPSATPSATATTISIIGTRTTPLTASILARLGALDLQRPPTLIGRTVLITITTNMISAPALIAPTSTTSTTTPITTATTATTSLAATLVSTPTFTATSNRIRTVVIRLFDVQKMRRHLLRQPERVAIVEVHSLFPGIEGLDGEHGVVAGHTSAGLDGLVLG